MENVSFGNDLLTNITLIPSTSVYTFGVLLVTGLPIFLENVLAVFIITRCEKLVYQIRYMSMNLSLAGCLLGLMLVIPPWVFENIFSCKVKKYFNVIGVMCSLTTTTFINLDRCLSLYFNMRYFEIITKKRLKAACIVAWLLAIFLAYGKFYTTESATGIDCILQGSYSALRYVSSTITRFLLVSNVPMFLYMVYYVKKKMTKIPLVTDSGVELGGFTSIREHTIRKVTVITGFLLACYTPSFILTELDEALNSPLTARMRFIAEILVILNSLVNPLLYVWRYYEARYQLLRILHMCNPKKAKELYRERQQYFSSFDIRTR